jgi:cob(I)alamin adenosyltransferase
METYIRGVQVMAKKGWKKKQRLEIHFQLMQQRAETFLQNIKNGLFCLDGENGMESSVKIVVDNIKHDEVQISRMTEELHELQEAWEEARD